MPQEYRLYLASSRREGPDYSSFARFRSGKAKDAVEDLFYQFVQRLAELEETEYEEVFIDGTKIESMANRYTFVWKTGVEKNLAKLKEKAKVVFNECGGKRQSDPKEAARVGR